MAKRKVKTNSYEEVRKKRLEENLKRFQDLGIMKISKSLSEEVKPENKAAKRQSTSKLKSKVQVVELRRSSRARNQVASYQDEVNIDISYFRKRSLSRRPSSDAIRMASYEERLLAMQIAEKLQKNLKAGNPSFVKSMVTSHVSSCFWLGLPTAFCKSNLPEKVVNMVLEDEDGTESDAVYIGRRTGLSGGWKGFALDHKLNDGDALVFELTEPTRFKVYIVRASNSLQKDQGSG